MNKKKKIIFLSILGILLLIGSSFAVWVLNYTQTNSNIITSACFDITYTDQDNINLEKTYPILDGEGRTLTPYQFRIKNKCSEYASFQVNLEVLNNTTLDSKFIKVMFGEATPKLLTSYTEVAKTLSDASSAYKMIQGFLQPNEEKAYTLRLWIDESVTLEDNVSNKIFSSKITIASTYKANAPTALEECEATYGEGAGACNIIAKADPLNSKCFLADENGIISSLATREYRMDDTDPPIVCSLKDEYGISYYLRGLHLDNNVKFANMCWKIIRTTGTGGIKMIYNGDLDANGTCDDRGGTHHGISLSYINVNDNIVYGDGYTKEGSTYTLNNTSTMNWSTDSDAVIGKYTCNNTSITCETPYYILSKRNDTRAEALILGQTTNYAQIGVSIFNSSLANTSLSAAGYMYGPIRSISTKTMTNSGLTILSSKSSSGTNFYYGDTISYSGGEYYITNQDGSNVTQLSWDDNYTSLPGKYTCRSTSKYNDTTLRCSTAYKVIDTTTKENYMIAEILEKGRTSVGTIRLSSNYIDNGDGTYSLSGTILEKSAMDWYTNYNSFKNMYFCGDYNQNTCTNMYVIISPRQLSFGILLGFENNYYYGESFTYNNGVYVLNNAEKILDFRNTTVKTSLKNHRYTCFNTIDNTCSQMYFVLDGNINYNNIMTLKYVTLGENETISDAIEAILNSSNTNENDSEIKRLIDAWYILNFKNTEYESYLEDTIFCNDRTIINSGSWSESGELGQDVYFGKKSVICPRKIDAFTVNDTIHGNGALTYPIGLFSESEHYLSGNNTAMKTNAAYTTITPNYYSIFSADMKPTRASTSGEILGDISSSSVPFGVRPAISLKPGTIFISGGDGTAANPYEVE